MCYVETKNLDGETNLKSRHAVPELTHLRTSTLIETEAKFVIEAEPADVNMFQYNAAVVLHDDCGLRPDEFGGEVGRAPLAPGQNGGGSPDGMNRSVGVGTST